ncbi:MAG TPA: YqhA family protein [Streptosporangiaceae bacterium]|nr:YqhA family protein [Streptosporangiaceae bacterium]
MPDEGKREITERRAGPPARRLTEGVERTLTSSMWLALLPVAFLLVSALASFVYAVAVLAYTVRKVAGHPFPVGHHIGSVLLEFDLFLIGATAMISAIGFYELFIGDIRVRGRDVLPGWLAMHDLNDLKSRVVSMIVLVLAVTFTEEAVGAPDALHLLEFGGGITAVIIALTVFQRWGSGHSGSETGARDGHPVRGDSVRVSDQGERPSVNEDL